MAAHLNLSARKVTASLVNSELLFSTSRSSGPGGQNVNKVNSKVTLRWRLANSTILTEEEKELLLGKLASRLTTEGELMITSQQSRSQQQNKKLVIEKLDALLTKAFAKKQVRKATKPSKAAVQNRIEKKKRHSEKKKMRRVDY
jgi:ribosome-associated protein